MIQCCFYTRFPEGKRGHRILFFIPRTERDRSYLWWLCHHPPRGRFWITGCMWLFECHLPDDPLAQVVLKSGEGDRKTASLSCMIISNVCCAPSGRWQVTGLWPVFADLLSPLKGFEHLSIQLSRLCPSPCQDKCLPCLLSFVSPGESVTVSELWRKGMPCNIFPKT